MTSGASVRARMRGVAGVAVALAVASGVAAGPARADVVAYLVNVTVRPGYNFVNADAAIAYGNTVCARVGGGRPFSELVGEVMGELRTRDNYQATYLIAQAANELCPQHIWQLRNSAAGYTGRTAP